MNKNNTSTTQTHTRRTFLTRFWLLLGLAALAELVWVAVSFVKPKKQKQTAATPSIITAGPVDSFDLGSVTAFPRGRFYLARLENGGFLALSRECTHLGCTVPWVEEENRFVCPCHASTFDIKGVVTNPPAPRPLDIFPVTIENDVVMVDVSEAVERKRFEVGQVVRGY
ncbi:MAG: ubiquinol-cytochrome c reductase iron-sulfur subunit [bacterium]|nr:MAG: ubiquinol-cytochrome c reductase iron-sulfur subunit [bacterium]